MEILGRLLFYFMNPILDNPFLVILSAIEQLSQPILTTIISWSLLFLMFENIFKLSLFVVASFFVWKISIKLFCFVHSKIFRNFLQKVGSSGSLNIFPFCNDHFFAFSPTWRRIVTNQSNYPILLHLRVESTLTGSQLTNFAIRTASVLASK